MEDSVSLLVVRLLDHCSDSADCRTWVVSYFYTVTKIDLLQPLPLWQLTVLSPSLPVEESAAAARRQLVGKFSRILKSIFVPDSSRDVWAKEAARGPRGKIEKFIRS